MKNFKNFREFSLIQFVPMIFVVSLVVNTVMGHVPPSVKKSVAGRTQVKAGENKKNKSAQGGDLDLRKIKDGVYQGTGTGYRGPLSVEVTVKSHKMTNIVITKSSDDSAYLNRAKNLISSILKNQTLNVDVISGATFSSKGIIAAVKNALTGEKDNTSAKAQKESGKAKKLAEADESGEYKDGSYTGTGKGFRGKIKVEVTVKNSKIQKIEVLKNEADDAAYFGRAKGVIPEIISGQTTNVDAVSGATYSSNGIIEAVRDALKKARKDKSGKSSTDKKTDKDKSQNESGSGQEAVKGTYKDGTYTGTGKGFRGNISVSVTVKDSKIVKIQILKNEKDDAAYFKKAQGVIDLILKAQGTDVDVVSGATFSSRGIIAAVNDALKKALAGKDDTSSGSQGNETVTVPEGSKVYTGEGSCEPDESGDFDTYRVLLEIVVDKGRITAVQNVKGTGNDYDSLNDIFLQSAVEGVVPQLLGGVSTKDCDTVSGATCSSYAIFDAFDDAVSKISE